MDQLLSVKKASAYLELSERKVRELCIKGDIKASKISGRGDWRIKEKDLEEFIQAHYPKKNGGKR